jgi:hypothetical protein
MYNEPPYCSKMYFGTPVTNLDEVHDYIRVINFANACF